MKKKARLRPREYDEAWKKILQDYFWEFMDFYFPKIAEQIEKSKGYEFLEQELQKIFPKSRARKRRLDKLVQVYLRDGQEI